MGYSMLLSAADLASLAFFLAVWVFHALATDGRLFSRVSLTTAMNAQREAWMRTMARRELRMIDTGIMLGLQQGTAFFASSALLAIGGCFALIGASDQVLAVLGDLPFAGAPARQVFEIKVIGLILLLAYAFFKFGWSYRLFNYCSILIGAVPVHREEATHLAEIEHGCAARRENEHSCRKALQRRPARDFLLNRVSWVVRRPADFRPVHPAAALRSGPTAVFLGRSQGRSRRSAPDMSSGPGNTESIRPANL